eukprot:1368004-Rhodomonas_salina.1
MGPGWAAATDFVVQWVRRDYHFFRSECSPTLPSLLPTLFPTSFRSSITAPERCCDADGLRWQAARRGGGGASECVSVERRGQAYRVQCRPVRAVRRCIRRHRGSHVGRGLRVSSSQPACVISIRAAWA